MPDPMTSATLAPSEPCLRCGRCAGCHAPAGDCPVPNTSCATGTCPQGPASAAGAARPLDVYVINGKRKPLATGQQVDAAKPLPAAITHDGGTYHFSNADLVDKTATFTNVPITWH